MLRENSKKEKVLELENRKKIYELVKKFSGCHFREIERRSGIPHGTLKYHLHFLEKNGLIKSKKESNTICYFPIEFESEKTKLLALLRQNTTRKIILFILQNENCRHEEITQFVKLSPSTVSWHLNKLLNFGIIEPRKQGRITKYKLAADKNEIIKILIIYRESFLDSLVNRVVEMWEVH